MMDLHKYPLDKQICDIRMESCELSFSKLISNKFEINQTLVYSCHLSVEIIYVSSDVSYLELIFEQFKDSKSFS